MHPDMRVLWNALGPLPGDLRLYGGTALALYLNHRASVDFGLASPQPEIDPSFVRRIPAFANTTSTGGPGMVDLTVEGVVRNVKVSFMECGTLIPYPSQNPISLALQYLYTTTINIPPHLPKFELDCLDYFSK